MMYQTKAATKSLSVVAQLVAIVVMALAMAGIDISADVAGLPEKVAGTTDAALVLIAQLVALYGRLRADKKISGLFKPKS